MCVAFANERLSLDCGSTPYQVTAGEDFYKSALNAIQSQPNITLHLGTSVVGQPSLSNGLWTIHTGAGTVLARSVVDTRPNQSPRLNGATLWQSFYGQEIECDEPIFDPELVDLMDFFPPDSRHVAFVYVLPVTTTRALIEITVFGAVPLPPSFFSEQLRTLVAAKVKGNAYTTLRFEDGILPMGLSAAPQSIHESYVYAGILAGGARPSTGFAFQRIQRWASECADSVIASGSPTRHKSDPWPLRVMDQIFLEVLRANPRIGGAIFFSLFKRAHPARVIRFLSGSAGVADSLAVIIAMPILPFIEAAFALMWRQIKTLGAQSIR